MEDDAKKIDQDLRWCTTWQSIDEEEEDDQLWSSDEEMDELLPLDDEQDEAYSPEEATTFGGQTTNVAPDNTAAPRAPEDGEIQPSTGRSSYFAVVLDSSTPPATPERRPLLVPVFSFDKEVAVDRKATEQLARPDLQLVRENWAADDEKVSLPMTGSPTAYTMTGSPTAYTMTGSPTAYISTKPTSSPLPTPRSLSVADSHSSSKEGTPIKDQLRIAEHVASSEGHVTANKKRKSRPDETPGKPAKRCKKRGTKNPCHLCTRSFTRPSDLARHLQNARVHNNAAGFTCGACGSTLNRLDSLKRHQERFCSHELGVKSRVRNAGDKEGGVAKRVASGDGGTQCLRARESKDLSR
ncbi:hypothetical protein BV25DRAFT_779056 [Artomyces pyxidatus]|uniref:Uncharacterized protein n=1 Tax=Artomyces pyxidatus TaxID=48021 RepID=A0ACB8SYV2_9AGAM|nr:hypothetical protein BV25DRAFT_779056 [Artomyces pyxidatus]